jgi:hypothetical protein
MTDRKREIYIKFENVDEFITILNDIKKQKDELRKKMKNFEDLNFEENKIFENWFNYFEDTLQKLDHISL